MNSHTGRHPSQVLGIPRGLWKRLLTLKLAGEQNHRCCYCGRPIWVGMPDAPLPKRLRATIEHVVAKAQFRRAGLEGWERFQAHTNEENLAAACAECNNTRGDLTDADDFFAIRSDPLRWAAWLAEHNFAPRPDCSARELAAVAAWCPDLGPGAAEELVAMRRRWNSAQRGRAPGRHVTSVPRAA